MTSRLLPTLFAACSLLLASCLPESKNPLSTPANSVIDARLEGVYAQRSKDPKDDPGYWHFHYRGAKAKGEKSSHSTPWLEILSVEHLPDGGLKTHRYEALTTRLGGHDYFSFLEVPEAGQTHNERPYCFARYEVNWRGELRFWLASDPGFGAAIKVGHLRGKVIPGKSGDVVQLTDTTAHLAAFIAQADPKVLFSGDPLILRRIAR